MVTGTSRGIGKAIAAALSNHRVVGHSSRGGTNEIAADLSLPDAADSLWQQALDQLDGRIDILVNNAGIFENAPAAMPADEWRAAWQRMMQINLFAAADLCRLAVLHFQQQGGGRIVNIASRAAYRGDSPEHWHYAASKAGMIGMTKTMARGFAAQNILIFAVAPGFVMTGMADDYLETRGGKELLRDIPLGKVASPHEVAETVRWLAVDAPASATGSVIDVNGASYVR